MLYFDLLCLAITIAYFIWARRGGRWRP